MECGNAMQCVPARNSTFSPCRMIASPCHIVKSLKPRCPKGQKSCIKAQKRRFPKARTDASMAKAPGTNTQCAPRARTDALGPRALRPALEVPRGLAYEVP